MHTAGRWRQRLQRELEVDGFVHLPGLVGAAAVRRLGALFEEIRPDDLIGIYTNMHDNSFADNLRVDASITGVFGRYVDDLFEDCYLAGASFFAKGTDAESQSTPHQDRNNVDERRFMSLSMWCPLIDVDGGNGALQLTKGSHRWFETLRSITIPSANFFFGDELQPFLFEVPAQAGDMVVHAHNLFHGSKPNRSGRVRPVAVAGVLPQEAGHIHYYRDPRRGLVEIFEIDRNFYYSGLKGHYDGHRPETLKSLGTMRYDVALPTLDDIREHIASR